MDETIVETPPLRATFFGTTTILFEDGQDSILIDGFFTRPSLFTCLVGNISPDEDEIRKIMKEANIDRRLRAVFVAHSHYDHAMDAPSVCKLTGALLVGSTSTAMIGIGNKLPKDQIKDIADGETLQFGSFKVTTIEGIHSPGDRIPGDITAPLSFPCGAKQMRTGKCYSYLIEHGNSRTFVHPSANYVPGKLDSMKAATLFLGIGVLGNQTTEFQDEYWKHVVQAVGPKLVIPIHWDNFWRKLEHELVPLPWFLDSWATSRKYLEGRCAREEIQLHFPRSWEEFKL